MDELAATDPPLGRNEHDVPTNVEATSFGAGARALPSRHVALFIYALTGGGAQRRTLTLANAFAARGHVVDLVVVRSEGVLNGELSPAVRLVGLDRGWRSLIMIGDLVGQRGLQTALSVPALARYLRRARPDVLLSAASHVNVVATLAWRLARVPLPLVLRASNHPSGNLSGFPLVQRPLRAYLRWLARRLYPRADAVIAVSNGVGDEVARLSRLPPERVTAIYNPVVTPALGRRMSLALVHPWFAPGAPPVILSAGRLTLQKDFGTLIRAFGQVRAARAARLVILGEGPQRDRLRRLVADLGLGADVLLPGYVDNPLVWMKRASVFALCSRWEGLPGVLIEALACGCPVVSTDCPSGPAEILDRGVFGRLVPVGQPRPLATALEAALDAPPDRNRLRARAALFGGEVAIDRYLDVLEQCIERRAAAGLGWRRPWAPTAPSTWTSEARLADRLSTLGVGRGDLVTGFPGNAPHRQVMARMMVQLGIDLQRTTERHWQPLKAAAAICSRCPTVSHCRSWLERTNEQGPESFCPNARLWHEIAVAQGRRPAAS